MRNRLLATTLLTSLSSMTALPALAFDESNWTWVKTVEEAVAINVDVSSTINPTGHVELQDAQFFTGDVVARSAIDGDFLSNAASEPADLTGTILVPVEVPVSGNLNLNGSFDANADTANITTANLNADELEGLTLDNAVVDPASQISVQPSVFNFDIAVEGTATGEQEVDLSSLGLEVTTLDATEHLGNAAGAATAIANFKNIQTETATFLDESQIHEATNGTEEGAGILAQSTAGNLENAAEVAVDLESTAISNLLTINSMTDDPNNIFIGDVSQETNANMLADASANLDLSGYNNLANYQGLTDADGNAIAGRVASLAATAIGNFADIKVGPSVDIQTP